MWSCLWTQWSKTAIKYQLLVFSQIFKNLVMVLWTAYDGIFKVFPSILLRNITLKSSHLFFNAFFADLWTSSHLRLFCTWSYRRRNRVGNVSHPRTSPHWRKILDFEMFNSCAFIFKVQYSIMSQKGSPFVKALNVLNEVKLFVWNYGLFTMTSC